MDRLLKVHAALQKRLPKLNIKYKSESTLMKILGFLLFFNKNFMTTVTTTIGQTVYFPNRERVEKNELNYIATLSHEYVHAKDSKTNFFFSLLYLFPLILAPLMWFFAFIHWGLALGLFLLFLMPLPAYFRKYYEIRGYVMTLFVANEIMKEQNSSYEVRQARLEALALGFNEQFTGPNYYFMWPFGVEDNLSEAIDNILSGEILEEDDVFPEVLEAFIDSKN